MAAASTAASPAASSGRTASGAAFFCADSCLPLSEEDDSSKRLGIAVESSCFRMEAPGLGVGGGHRRSHRGRGGSRRVRARALLACVPSAVRQAVTRRVEALLAALRKARRPPREGEAGGSGGREVEAQAVVAERGLSCLGGKEERRLMYRTHCTAACRCPPQRSLFWAGGIWRMHIHACAARESLASCRTRL